MSASLSAKELYAQDVIEVGNQFYIRAESSLADSRTLVLLHGDTFAVFDRFGDIQNLGSGQQGLFYQEARHLSYFETRVNGLRALLLSSTVREDNVLLGADLTNPDMDLGSDQPLLRGTVHILRNKFLSDGKSLEQFTLHNYGQKAVELEMSFCFAADFSDIFEVRGSKRERRGSRLPDEIDRNSITLAYQGLDQVVRRTRLVCSPLPCTIRASEIRVPIQLEPHEEKVFSLDVLCESAGVASTAPDFEHSLQQVNHEREISPLADVEIWTHNEQFNDWLNRSRADMEMMVANTPFGPYPYAGVPWFSTVFGRDGIISAFEMLWLAPSVSRGVLSFLAATQATGYDAERDAEPGKILHEMRKGEMAQLREVPFGRYYGSVDSTPLFVMLAAAYHERTNDSDFIRTIWPHIEAALEWIDNYGDVDRDGFVEYARQSENGLLQQGWKDSQDSVFHSDGAMAEGPIALCEVQSYVYAAKKGIATVAQELGFDAKAEKLRRQAEELKRKFEALFWCDELSMFALALDGQKRPCQVRSSNAGHCLFSGIASAAQMQQTQDALLTGRMFSGWGVRTLATGEKRYNPMSYHNGSVWPHDNAMVAFGVTGSLNKELALRILTGLLDLSIFVDLHRLPELVCGFSRRPGKGPTLYPVACSPQAWAAGAVFLTLQACLGVSIRGKESQLYLNHSALPEAVPYVRIRNLRVGEGSVDLAFNRHAHSVGIDILKRSGNVEIVALK